MSRNRAGCLRWIILVFIGGIVYFLFQFEIRFLRNLVLTLIHGGPVEGLPEISEALKITLYISLNSVATVFLVVLVLYWIASSAFPVQNNYQVYQLMRRIQRSIFGRGSPLAVVREGMLVGEVGNLSSSALLVDLESRIVVEGLRLRSPPSATEDPSSAAGMVSIARVLGPGLILLRRGERLRDIVQLRKQFRIQPNVQGQSSDGIELHTNTFAIFTLCQPPNIIHVAYNGAQKPEQIFVLQIQPQTRKILAIKDELDDQDKHEIHDFAQNFLYFLQPDSSLEVYPNQSESPPYWVDSGRVLTSVYSRARTVGDRSAESRWSDLPVMVSAETYRNLIARYTLDALFLPEDPINFPLNSEVKPEFARRIRHMGVMAYQFLQRNDGEQPQVGQRVDHRNFRISAVNNLHGSKMLRDRGIKIIQAGFGELFPTDPDVNQQRVKNWRARWQQEANSILAGQDQELMRIKDQARVNREREMVEKLSLLMQDPTNSEETLSVQIFQELEKACSDTMTRQQMPQEMINQLRAIRLWLLPEENVKAESADGRKSENQEGAA